MKKTNILVFLCLVAAVSADCLCGSKDSEEKTLNRKPPRKSPRIAELSAPFENGGDQVKPLNEVPKDDILLELYALNQLGRLGDVDANRPGILDWKRKAELEALNKKKVIVEDKPKPIDVKKQQEITLQEQFNKAAINVKKLKKSPRNDEMVELYALYKQATIGDVNTADPGKWNFRDKIKWDAWNHKRGTSREKAKQDYINKVNELIGRFGI